MPFDARKCRIPSVYCGNGNIPQPRAEQNIRYTGVGTNHQCMQKGFGAGAATERLKTLPAGSLQRIKYVGEKYEENFRELHFENRLLDIRTQRALNDWVRNTNKNQIERMLRLVFTKANGVLDLKAYNSTLLHLHNATTADIPECVEIH
jgi:hypothetical protein